MEKPERLGKSCCIMGIWLVWEGIKVENICSSYCTTIWIAQYTEEPFKICIYTPDAHLSLIIVVYQIRTVVVVSPLSVLILRLPLNQRNLLLIQPKRRVYRRIEFRLQSHNLISQSSNLGALLSQQYFPIVAILQWDIVLEHSMHLLAKLPEGQFPPG